MSIIRSTFRTIRYFTGEEGAQRLFLRERNGRFYVETPFATIYATKDIGRAIDRFEKEVVA